VWQALRDELHPQGFELVTVGLDTLGADGCRVFMEAAEPTHPALIDQYHLLARTLGVINIPSAVWIDESGTIVRPAEPAPLPRQRSRDQAPPQLPPGTPERIVGMMTEAAKIPSDSETYHAALRDWISKGSKSQFALTPEQVIARSRPRDDKVALGHAHFELASALELAGHHQAAIEHFRKAHELVPDSWTFRRQAWSLEPGPDGPLKRFWQGPDDSDPESWPYAGDWLSDVRKAGAENYNEPFKP
jgi:tetratricopeptide (TPR) repeat protein